MSAQSEAGGRPSWLTKVLAERTALLLQELQEGVVGEGSMLPALADACAAVGLLERAVRLATAARQVGVQVIHCTAETMPGGFGANRNARLFAAARRARTGAGAGAGNQRIDGAARPVSVLGPAPEDLVVPRYHGLSPLNGSSLNQLLHNAGVRTLVVAGVSLNIAIPNLVFDAVNAGFQVVVVRDAVAATPVDYGPAVLENSLSLVATLAATDDVVSAWSGRS
jgi:nicotinamidase-related amidase